MRGLRHRIVHARKFEYLLIVLISFNSIMQGLRLSLDTEPDWLPILTASLWFLMLVVFVLEVALKMFALSPRIDRYFRDSWNAFDFLVISSLIVAIVVFESIASYELLIILVRLLRLLRGISIVQELNLILATLFRSVPSVCKRRC